MNRAVVIPGPELVIWWGVDLPLLSAAFGIVGIVIGHFIAPAIGAPPSVQRQLWVIAGGVLISLGITMATGQKPLLVLAWSLGVGFSGTTIFQTLGEHARAGFRTLGEQVIERLRQPPAADAAAPAHSEGPASRDGEA